MNKETISNVLRHCNICNKDFPLEKCVKGEYEYSCLECRLQKARIYKSTLRGKISELLGTAKSRARKRATKNRNDSSGDFTITREDLEQLWKRQQGFCHYSGLPMELEFGSDWYASLERLNPAQGYVKSNVVFCCQEFNGTEQWNSEKFQFLLQADQLLVDIAKLKQQMVKPSRKAPVHYNTREKMTLYGEEFLKCRGDYCLNDFKHISEFYFIVSNGCIFSECNACQYLGVYRFVIRLIQSAITHCKRKRKKMKKQEQKEITIQQIFSKIIEQGGRCYYSNMPLKFQPNVSWKCSLERLNNEVGYINENVVLVCYEFNTAKQWSKAKFQTALASIRNKYQAPVSISTSN